MKENVKRKILGLGDNVLDRYIDKGIMYPGGNAVNISVMCKRYGMETAYLGSVGSDEGGRHLLKSLEKEGVDISYVQVKERKNSYSNIRIINCDRRFEGSDMSTSNEIELNVKEFEYIKKFDLVHTSIYSNLENKLAEIRETGILTSFDFSDEFTKEYLDKVLPHVDYAFLSGSDYSENEILNLIEEIAAYNLQLVVVTKGKDGAFCMSKEGVYRQDVVSIVPVDTLGAGDSFISRVLVGVLKEEETKIFLEEAAKKAAETCMYEGAFGYGIAIK